jgi:hypothetical protein
MAFAARVLQVSNWIRAKNDFQKYISLAAFMSINLEKPNMEKLAGLNSSVFLKSEAELNS